MAKNNKICESTILSAEEKKKKRDVELKKMDIIINNTLVSSENQAQNELATRTDKEIDRAVIEVENILTVVSSFDISLLSLTDAVIVINILKERGIIDKQQVTIAANNAPSLGIFSGDSVAVVRALLALNMITQQQLNDVISQATTGILPGQEVQAPQKLGKKEDDPKEFTSSIEIERKLAPQLQAGQTLQDAPKVVQDEIKSQKKTTKTTFKLPKDLVEEIISNPILDIDLLEDLEKLTTQTRVIDPCDPETLAEQIKEFKELGKNVCFPTVPTTSEKEAQRNKILPQVDEFIEEITPDSELINEAEAQKCIGGIEIAIKTIKVHTDFVKEELENIGEKVITFFSLMASFDYQFHALLLYAKRYNETLYMTEIDNTLDALESKITNLDLPNSLVANTYKNFLLQQITFWRSQVQDLDSTEIIINIINVAAKETSAKNKYDNIPPLLEDEFSRLTHSANIHDIQFFTNLGNRKGKLTDLLIIMSREPTQQEKENDTYFEHLMQETKVELESNMFPLITNTIRSRNIATAQLIHPILKHRGTQNNFLRSRFRIVSNSWIPFIEDVINTYEISDRQSQMEKSIEILHQAKCIDDKPIVVPKKEEIEVNIDLDWKTFPEDAETDVKKLKYWQHFQKTLNKVALLPKHYSIGLLVPSPTGVVRVPFPVIWIPIVVIPTKVSVIVIWLTINGVVVSPTTWIWKFKPIGDGKSVHQTLFRGGNKTIKDKTRTESQSLGVVNGLDLNPKLTKTSPFIVDDIPAPERISISNILFVSYLNKWCSTARPQMGFP